MQFSLPPWQVPALGPRTTTFLLFVGVFAVLILATLFGSYLRHRVRGRRVRVIESYMARVRGWWVMVAVLGLGFLAGRKGIVLLFAFASFGALREFITLSPSRRGDHWTLVASFFLILPLHYLAIWQGWEGFAGLFIPVLAFLFLPIIAALSGDAKRFMDRAANLQWGLMICVYCISYVPALLGLRIAAYHGRNLLLIAFLVLLVQGADVLQKFFSARLAKPTLLAPEMSQTRTREGFALAVASSAVLGALLAWITPFSILGAAFMAATVSLFGLLGGLVMSAIKRDRGVRYWGHAIVGHGGMLDRAAPVAFAAPIYFFLIRHYWAA